MDATALAQISTRLKNELARSPAGARVAIVGLTAATFDLVRMVSEIGAKRQLLGVYADVKPPDDDAFDFPLHPIGQLGDDAPDLVLIASDFDKELLLRQALPHLTARMKVVIGGFEHFKFRDTTFDREVTNAYAPSFANGYPNSLIHIYQCLKNAARLDLAGVVAEFGMFKGGTTMLISRFIEALGRNWKVYGFDTFDGFPAPRSALDMYAHPDCVYLGLETVRRQFEGRNVEIIAGDIVETARCLSDKDVVLAFVDTDNYSSAMSVLEAIADRIVVGGAIVFDHFTGRDRFLYTLGERLAAATLLGNPRFFNLHDTGVFLRMR